MPFPRPKSLQSLRSHRTFASRLVMALRTYRRERHWPCFLSGLTTILANATSYGDTTARSLARLRLLKHCCMPSSVAPLTWSAKTKIVEHPFRGVHLKMKSNNWDGFMQRLHHLI